MVGRKLGKYHVVETLGRGGMGTVYKAIDETLDREVAIKILNPDLMDGETVKRFRHEAVTLAKLNHPRIAHVYDLAREGDSLLMVMEYVRGETFEKLSTRSGPLPLDRAVVLYRLVTAQLPFKADTAVAMIQSQLNDPPTPSRRYRNDLPDWLDNVLTCALAKAPADRYQTAEQLREALQYGLTGSSQSPAPIDALEPAIRLSPTPTDLRPPASA